jgi:hypothetical protein
MRHPTSAAHPRFELRFHPLHPSAREIAVPCDASGHVELDTLSRPDLMRYLYARAVVGRGLEPPTVTPAETGEA